MRLQNTMHHMMHQQNLRWLKSSFSDCRRMREGEGGSTSQVGFGVKKLKVCMQVVYCKEELRQLLGRAERFCADPVSHHSAMQ